jgi:flagellar protein FlaG
MINDIVKSGSPTPTPVRASAPVEAVETPANLPRPDAAADKAVAEEPRPEQLQAAVSKLNDYVQNIRRTLSFSIEESTGRTVIKVYDAETEELIRQIPPEETMKLAERISEQIRSLFVQERA